LVDRKKGRGKAKSAAREEGSFVLQPSSVSVKRGPIAVERKEEKKNNAHSSKGGDREKTSRRAAA